MRLTLYRKTAFGQTNGLLFHKYTPWTKTLEYPSSNVPEVSNNMQEGIYTLSLEYCENAGWYPKLVHDTVPLTVELRPLLIQSNKHERVLYTVTEYWKSAYFSKLAMLKLLEKIGRYSSEILSVEVINVESLIQIPPWFSQTTSSH